jgi:hypothetical protein
VLFPLKRADVVGADALLRLSADRASWVDALEYSNSICRTLKNIHLMNCLNPEKKKDNTTGVVLSGSR